jgi:lysyl-tRNA synthetase class 1
VTYEEGGKDLLTAGGSRERSNEIYREVFKKEPPPGLQHEFFTFGGKKMASSKGIGAEAVEIVGVYPPEIVRFLMLRTPPKRHLEFDPAGMTLPRLVDEYDRAADAYREDAETDLAKTWRLSQISPTPTAPGFRVRFTTVANWLQIPSIKPEAEAEKEKGARLTDAELRELHGRLELARAWLERWAPDEAKFEVQDTTPPVELSSEQRRYLFAIKALIGTVHDADQMQNELYELAKKVGLVNADGKPSRDAFAAIYLAFIGKPKGPRAGWLLLSIEPERVRRRLDDLGRAA